LKGFPDDLGDDIGLADLGAVLGDGTEQVHQIEDLVALLVHPGGGALAGDRDHWRSIHVRISHTRNEVGGAGPSVERHTPALPVKRP
jgi:hypothetical protein